jgi:hypothetical protein
MTKINKALQLLVFSELILSITQKPRFKADANIVS